MAVEPTALALLALPPTSVREREAAIGSLLHAQNPNGSWPAFLGDHAQGSGYTGLALYALSHCSGEGMATTLVATLLDPPWRHRWDAGDGRRHNLCQCGGILLI